MVEVEQVVRVCMSSGGIVNSKFKPFQLPGIKKGVGDLQGVGRWSGGVRGALKTTATTCCTCGRARTRSSKRIWRTGRSLHSTTSHLTALRGNVGRCCCESCFYRDPGLATAKECPRRHYPEIYCFGRDCQALGPRCSRTWQHPGAVAGRCDFFCMRGGSAGPNARVTRLCKEPLPLNAVPRESSAPAIYVILV